MLIAPNDDAGGEHGCPQYLKPKFNGGIILLFEERVQSPDIVSICMDCIEGSIKRSPSDIDDWSAGVDYFNTLEVIECIV
jgi:hypothetical protein